MTKKIRTSIFAAIGLLMLILDTKTALLGASEGLQLCIRTIIPSLLPFFVLSMLLTSSLIGENIRILKPIASLFGIPEGAESILAVGVLGGYPAGAQAVSQAYRGGALRKEDAQRMLAFCNLAGPAFLFGIVGGKFSSIYAPWALWGIQLISALLVSLLLRSKTAVAAPIPTGMPMTVSIALRRSLEIMAGVCGWIILFRVMIAFLDRWILWLLPPWLQVVTIGLLELSNGCCDLGIIAGEGLRFLVSAGLLAFGGLCVFMQTVTVANGLSLQNYFNGKILQCLFSIVLSFIVQPMLFKRSEIARIPFPFWIGVGIVIIVFVKFLRKSEKKSSISQLVGV